MWPPLACSPAGPFGWRYGNDRAPRILAAVAAHRSVHQVPHGLAALLSHDENAVLCRRDLRQYQTGITLGCFDGNGDIRRQAAGCHPEGITHKPAALMVLLRPEIQDDMRVLPAPQQVTAAAMPGGPRGSTTDSGLRSP